MQEGMCVCVCTRMCMHVCAHVYAHADMCLFAAGESVQLSPCRAIACPSAASVSLGE